MVQDPNFWKRFSTAVHADEAEKEQLKDRPDLKHSYVSSRASFELSPTSPTSPHLYSAPASPTSQAPLSPYFSPIDHMPAPAFSPIGYLPSPSAPPPAMLSSQRREERAGPHHRHVEGKTQLSQAKPPARQPSKLRKPSSTRSSHPLLPRNYPLPSPPPSHYPSTRRSSSASLNLTGRSKATFKTWTTITATNDMARTSWLESQTRKRRQRTWICWCFWLGFMVLVAGVVVTVVVLRREGIL